MEGFGFFSYDRDVMKTQFMHIQSAIKMY